MDEFSDTNGIRITQLNQMCDGTYQYPTKGGIQSKVDFATLICCGNVDPAVLFPGDSYQIFSARFKVFCLD